MTSIGTGYDLSNSTFSPDGRIFQVEYAAKAVENGETAIGIRCTDGVILALEKLVGSKLLKGGANTRLGTIDWNMGMVSSGLAPDGRHLVQRAREEAAEWRKVYKASIPVASLADRIGSYVSMYTLYNSVRPFGVAAIMGGWDAESDAVVDGEVGNGPKSGPGGRVTEESEPKESPASASVRRGGPGLYMVEPSGMYWGYYGAATGKGRQAAKAELEKLNLHESPPTLEQGIKDAARIIYVAHEDSKDKEFELEMMWVSGLNGPTKGKMEQVPEELRKEAERLAKKSLEADDDDDDDDDENEEEERMQE